MDATLHVNVSEFTHADEVDEVLPLGLNGHMKSGHLFLETKNVWVHISI